MQHIILQQEDKMDFRKDILEASELPEGEKVWLRKGFAGWKVVKPIRNEDGTFNWFNFLTGGSWTNIILTIIIVAIILLAIYEYTTNINVLLDCFNGLEQLEICKQSFGYL